MRADLRRRSRAYVAAQFGLIALLAAAVLLDDGRAMPLPAAVATAGLVLCAVGFALGGSALVAMGRVMQVSPEPKSEGHLVTRGVYRHFRHPMYTAITLIAFGLVLRKPTLLVTLASGALIAMLLAKARFEERLLAERYPEYEDYRARTWGVLPGPRRNR